MTASTTTGGQTIRFGPFEVTDQVFLTTRHSFGLVNLKPLVPGHVLVCPLKPHRRLTDLSAGETADLFTAVQLAQRMLARVYLDASGGSFTVAVQDGPEAGQTVPHVHVHVIPRVRDDMGPGASTDDVYVRMASEQGNVGGALWDREQARPAPGGGMPRIDDADRAPRTAGQMNGEAERYREALREMRLASE
ncbi:hypothetical protein HIM_00476 [Hirsutella minnesotensis 3608]|nr:hypothetical protein HIM_00476 [Hirsutella minnesotensis 3608]